MLELNTVNALAFLESAFFGLECWIRFLYLRKENTIVRYYRPVEIDEIGFIGKLEDIVADGYNIFFSACGRKYKSGKLEDVCIAPSLWVDLDAKHFNEDMYRTWTLLESFKPHPTFIVNSGHGHHGYWLLQEPFEVTSETDRLEFQGYLYGLAKTLSGDSVFDLTRMMRLPETVNYKDPNSPVVCRFRFMSHVHAGGIILRYELSDFSGYYAEPPTNKTYRVTFSGKLPMVDVHKLDISQKLKERIFAGDASDYRSRSERDMAICVALVAQGCSDDEIRAIFNNYACGDKYKERGDAYLSYTIGKARSYIQKQWEGELIWRFKNEEENN